MTWLDVLNGVSGEALRLMVRQSLYVVPIFAVVAFASWALRRRGPGLHFALWSLVLLRLVLPPNLSHPASATHFLSGLISPVSAALVDGQSPFSEVGLVPVSSSGQSLNPDRPTFPWALFGLGAWLVGALCVGARMWAVRSKYRLLAHRSRGFGDLRSAARLWRQRFAVRRKVRVVTTNQRLSPFTVGVLRPIIVLPEALVARRRSCDAAIAHEMAHVKRLDALWTDIQRLLHCLFYFHPLVWYAGSRLDLERERLCDAAVLGSGRITPRSYAGALVDVAGLGLTVPATPAFTQSKRRVYMRVHSILLHRTVSFSSRCLAAVLVLLLGVLFLPLAGEAENAVPSSQPAVAPPMPTTSSPSPATPAVAPAAPPTTPSAASPALAPMADPVPEARLTQAWGTAMNPFTGKEVFHRGLDLAAPQGTAVHAGADGAVSQVLVDYEGKDTGRFIIIDHGGGWSSYYGHLDEVLVAVGETVTRGQAIATVGMTGLTTGPHIHFEVTRDGERIDPGLLIEQ